MVPSHGMNEIVFQVCSCDMQIFYHKAILYQSGIDSTCGVKMVVDIEYTVRPYFVLIDLELLGQNVAAVSG